MTVISCTVLTIFKRNAKVLVHNTSKLAVNLTCSGGDAVWWVHLQFLVVFSDQDMDVPTWKLLIRDSWDCSFFPVFVCFVSFCLIVSMPLPPSSASEIVLFFCSFASLCMLEELSFLQCFASFSLFSGNFLLPLPTCNYTQRLWWSHCIHNYVKLCLIMTSQCYKILINCF